MPTASPVMSAETESSMLLESRPVRVSGWLALLLGLLSSLALFTTDLLVFAVLAIAVGLYAIRGYVGAKPIGYRAAITGMMLAVLFSTWALSEQTLRSRYMIEHGEVFARDWLTLVQQNQLNEACQLLSHPNQRQDSSVPLDVYFQESENGRQAMSLFRENEVYARLIQAGLDPQFAKIRPTGYRNFSNRHLVDVYWSDSSGKLPLRFVITLEYHPPQSDGETAQWSVESCGELKPDV